MKYEPIPKFNMQAVQAAIFSNALSNEEKCIYLYSAIYNLIVEHVHALLCDIFATNDFVPKLGALRIIDVFMQSRSTNMGFNDYIKSRNE